MMFRKRFGNVITDICSSELFLFLLAEAPKVNDGCTLRSGGSSFLLV